MHTLAASNAAVRASATADLRRAGLRDIAPVFNLILHGSLHGHFSNRYLEPRYMAGLGRQLFGVVFLGRLRLPDGSRHRARLQVARLDGQLAGFLLARATPNGEEIYMCAVDESCRRQGIAAALLKRMLAAQKPGSDVSAECLPASEGMKQLLLAHGFAAGVMHDDAPAQAFVLRAQAAPEASLRNAA